MKHLMTKCSYFHVTDDDDDVFVVWLTDERRLALFPAGSIVTVLHNRESPTRREQGWNPSPGSPKYYI